MSNALLSTVSLRHATGADWPLLRRWLAQPGVAAWWGDASSAEAEITMAMGTRAAMTRIVVCDGSPVGYAQAIDAALVAGGLPAAVPPGSWDADIFIGSPEHQGKGIGSRALELLTGEVFSTTLAVAVSLWVAVANERAVRAYEKAGFAWVGIEEDPIFGPCWVMLRRRPVAARAPAGAGGAERPRRK